MIQNSKGSMVWVLWVGDVRNIHKRASLLEIIIGTWSCLSWLFQVFFLKIKKASLKKCEPLKNNKNSSQGKIYKKDIEKSGKMKNKINNESTTIKLFNFIFCIWKRIYFAWNHSLGKVYAITFQVKFFKCCRTFETM